MRKIFILIIFSIVFFSGIYFLFPEIFSYDLTEVIRKYHDKWLSLYQIKPLKIISLFMIFNIVMSFLPIPGISMISFLGGSIFGFIPGVIYSSIATGIGNLFGFLGSRYFLRNWVIKKYGKKIKIFEKDWQTRGAMALFSFRLFPLIPSFVANLVMGVSPLGLWTFFWVSFIGRLPIVIAYTYAGVKVASLEHISDALHPSIIGLFIVIGLIPWLLKYIFENKSKAL